MREKKNYPLGAVRAESLVGKNVVNMYDGVRICTIREVEFTFESQTGEIELLPKDLTKPEVILATAILLLMFW